MPTYVIERGIPSIGASSDEELRTISEKSHAVLDGMGSEVHWIQSYVTADKLYCVYAAPDAEQVREHARRGGFPADTVSEVSAMMI